MIKRFDRPGSPECALRCDQGTRLDQAIEFSSMVFASRDSLAEPDKGESADLVKIPPTPIINRNRLYPKMRS